MGKQSMVNTGNDFAIKVKKRLGLGRGGSEVTLLIAYILICAIFAMMSPHFLSVRNFLNIGTYSGIIGISAAAMTLVLIGGGLDISVGGIMGLAGMVCAILLRGGTSTAMAIIVALFVGTSCGAFNGLMISKAKVNPLITTLSTMSIFRGIGYLSNNGISIVINDNAFKWIGRGYIGFMPFTVVILLAFFVGMWYLASYTAFGRKIYAIGSNKRASYLAGINTNRITFLVYLVSGMAAAVAGVLMAAQSGAGLPTAGIGYELTIISACILGGTSLAGGRGSVWGTFLGVLMLTTISNGLTMLAVPTFWQQIIRGGILLGAVLIDVLRTGAYKNI